MKFWNIPEIFVNDLLPVKFSAFPKQSFQRFAPYLSEKPRRESLTDQPNQDSIEMSPIGSTLFIPRQRLLFVLLNDKKVCIVDCSWYKIFL